MSAQTDIRRSPVSRRLANAQRAAAATSESDSRVRLADLSLRPRWGLKGRDVFTFLAAKGAQNPGTDNRAMRQPDGSVIARLSPGEALILAPPGDGGSSLGNAVESVPSSGQGACYPVPRRDSHCWFAIVGAAAPAMFAKLCGVDLSPDRFADGAIAQTSIARLSAIVIRHDVADMLAFFLLAETASAEYLWGCLDDAMKEFEGHVEDADAIWPVAEVQGTSQ
jgi:sarcosine oxidase subunit gamma